MTVKLSRLKANKIIRLLFRGLTQVGIAERTGVDQSTISIYFLRFKEITKSKGLLNAGKEFGVESEVEALRSLAVEMANAGLTSEEAKVGLKIYKAFLKLGVRPEQHRNLIKVCSKINNQDFVQAAIKYTEIENEMGLNYGEALDLYTDVKEEIPMLRQTKQELDLKVQSANQAVTNTEARLLSLRKQIQDLETKYRNEETSLKNQLSQSMQAKNVKEEEVKQAAFIKNQLQKEGFDITTFSKLLKEYSNE
ncbi:hypothetical protein ACFLV6_02090 [Chloroflexota bacterium]